MLICIWPLGFRLICIDTTGLLFKAQSFSCRPAVLHIFTLCLHMLHQALFWDMGAYHCFISLVKWHFYIKVPHCFICAYLSQWWKEQQCVHLQQGQTNLCTQCVVCIVSRKVQPHLWMLDRCTCPWGCPVRKKSLLCFWNSKNSSCKSETELLRWIVLWSPTHKQLRRMRKRSCICLSVSMAACMHSC